MKKDSLDKLRKQNTSISMRSNRQRLSDFRNEKESMVKEQNHIK